MITKRAVGGLMIFLSLAIMTVIGGVLLHSNSNQNNTPLIYSEKDMLAEMWSSYKRNYIESSTGRTLDKQQNNITTSEGQSYSMLRAVWIDDRQSFDRSWKWTKDNLQRDDYLMSWKFGPLADGKYGIQESVGGNNTASDGDSDIALSLLMAYSRWQEDDYLYDAMRIISSMWDKQVVLVNGKPVLAANDLERLNPERIIVNPSYLSPYAYKVFAHVDKKHDWQSLADNSYVVLRQAAAANLDSGSSAGLPPDWVSVDRRTGAMQAVGGDLKTQYGFDAFRTPWRLALDYAWNKDERSKELLASYDLLGREWQNNGRLAAIYNHDGSIAGNYEVPAAYGGSIGYFKFIRPADAKAIYTSKLTTLYSPDEQKPAKELSYYDDNWVWFGTALYLDQLPNLTVSQQDGKTIR